jgi:hypothetical protein
MERARRERALRDASASAADVSPVTCVKCRMALGENSGKPACSLNRRSSR